ncbi:MAG: heavy-metal-associated domain-containing protein [Candidatus Marinimicrobia bacterium]|nr:heavy-metal-associated domain-containing protein [Candidatus Neomarinimicrobiota bacterium]
MRKIAIIAGIVSIGLLACGKTDAKTTEITVKTAICGACVTTIEKAVSEVKGVEAVSVDLEKHLATVSYDANATNVMAIEAAIVNAGYAANDKPANPEAYEALPDSCKMDLEKGMESGHEMNVTD